MNEQELDLKLKTMTNELTALKTAHNRGLGAFKFFTAETTFVARDDADSTYLVEVTVTIEDGEPTPPFIQMGWTTPYYCQLQSARISNNNKTITYRIFYIREYVPAGTLLTFRAVSISKIASMTAKQGTWDV